MKRIANIFIIILCLFAGTASANLLENVPKTLFTESIGYECFDDQCPSWLEGALQNRMRPGDKVLCGMGMFAEREDGSATVQAVVALKRQAGIILYGIANAPESGTLQTRAETAAFLLPGDDFAFLPLRTLDENGQLSQVEIGLRKGNQILSLMVEEGKIYLSGCLTLHGDTGTLISFPHEMGAISCCTVQQGQTDQGEFWYGIPESEEEWISCPRPERLWTWEKMTLPGTVEEARTWENRVPVYPLPDNIAYIDGSLTVSPGTESESLGDYTARANVLETVPGDEFSWVHVRIGKTDGWISDENVYTIAGVMGEMGKVTPVGMARMDIPLYESPGGNPLGTVLAGTGMHVLCVNKGMAHVLISDRSICWPTDWDGTYGYVLVDHLAIGESPADAADLIQTE